MGVFHGHVYVLVQFPQFVYKEDKITLASQEKEKGIRIMKWPLSILVFVHFF